jgi:hypothetical protein
MWQIRKEVVTDEGGKQGGSESDGLCCCCHRDADPTVSFFCSVSRGSPFVGLRV